MALLALSSSSRPTPLSIVNVAQSKPYVIERKSSEPSFSGELFFPLSKEKVNFNGRREAVGETVVIIENKTNNRFPIKILNKYGKVIHELSSEYYYYKPDHNTGLVRTELVNGQNAAHWYDPENDVTFETGHKFDNVKKSPNAEYVSFESNPGYEDSMIHIYKVTKNTSTGNQYELFNEQPIKRNNQGNIIPYKLTDNGKVFSPTQTELFVNGIDNAKALIAGERIKPSNIAITQDGQVVYICTNETNKTNVLCIGVTRYENLLINGNVQNLYYQGGEIIASVGRDNNYQLLRASDSDRENLKLPEDCKRPIRAIYHDNRLVCVYFNQNDEACFCYGDISQKLNIEANIDEVKKVTIEPIEGGYTVNIFEPKVVGKETVQLPYTITIKPNKDASEIIAMNEKNDAIERQKADLDRVLRNLPIEVIQRLSINEMVARHRQEGTEALTQ